MKALLTIDKAGMLGDDVFDQVSAKAGLDLRDRAFMVELVRGVLRHRATLDWRLGLLSDRRITKLPTLVQTILRLGAYQLLYLDRVPDSAAVNESVRMIKLQSRRLGRDWSGFVNAVLRALVRAAEPEWPGSAKNPVEAYAVRYSCPTWLVERWCRIWGDARAEALCRASVEVPPLTLRVNRLRTTRAALLADLAAAQVEATATSISEVGIQLARSGSIVDLPGYAEGHFYVEDEAGQLVPLLLDVQPGQRVIQAEGVVAYSQCLTGLGVYAFVQGAEASQVLGKKLMAQLGYEAGTIMAAITDNGGCTAQHMNRHLPPGYQPN